MPFSLIDTPHPLVTVIIPVRDGEKFIGQAIDSILAQSVQGLELLVVDDASTDRTLEIVTSYSDARVRVLRNAECMGVSASRNRALEQTQTAYVAFLDADDIAYPQRLEKQIAYLDCHQNVVLVGSHLDYIDTQGNLLYSEQPNQRPCEPAALRMELLKRACILPSTATGRTKALMDAGGFPKMHYAEDHDLWCRLAVDHDLAVMPDRLVAYRHHPNQATFKKISASYQATQACIENAKGRFVVAGCMAPNDFPAPLSILGRLSGTPGSLGATYAQWADLHAWALKQPQSALSLAGMALFYSPLNTRAWRTLSRSLINLLVPLPVSRALHWYWGKFCRVFTDKHSG